MKLSIIIPVYNEKGTIFKILAEIEALPVEKEIIIVDDGSTDGTREILKEIQNSNPKNLKIIFKEKNEGKGSAIREGLKYVNGDVVVIQDADLEYNPVDLLEMLKVMEETGNEVIYGSRFLNRQSIPLINFIANKFLTWLTNILFSVKMTDMETCYKLCSKNLLLSLNLQTNGFEIEPEITCKILKKGIKIKEMSISYNPRRKGKKINWKDGIKAIFYIFKYRITR
ncbi:MAG TPA: glycosyltransferase family 2 protein [bacterium]|nr:glycosyltransferase family 2 protein [bacterium]HPP30081.1 glycosyltransferase family 2 protein [bacterium]